MLYLDGIIEDINSNYKEKLKLDFAVGLVQPTSRGNQIFPSYFINGELKYIGPDDGYKLSVYHKLNNNTYSEANNIGRNKYDKCVSQCSMIIFGKRTVESMQHFEQLFVVNLLKEINKERLSALNLKSVDIYITGSVMNPETVFSNEFKGVEFNLGEKHILIQLNYNIEAIYSAACFTNC